MRGNDFDASRRLGTVRRSELLNAVARASEALTRITDLHEAMREAGRVLVTAVGVCRFVVFRWDATVQGSELFAEVCAEGVESVESALGGTPQLFTDFKEVFVPLMEGRVYTSPVSEKTGRNAAVNLRSGVKTDLFTPVFIGRRFWGMLCFDDTAEERVWTDDEIAPLQTASEAFAAAVQRNELESEVRRGRELRMAELARANAILQRCLEPVHGNDSADTLLQRVVAEMCTLMHAVTGTSTVLSEAGDGEHTSVVFDGNAWRPLSPEYTSWDTTIAEAVGSEAVLVCGRTGTYPIGAGTRRYLNTHGLDWLVTAVIAPENTATGVLSVFGRGEPIFTPADLALFRTLAHQATLALRLTHLAHAARRAAVLEERNRLARDIHDTISQGLSGIVMQSSALRSKLGHAALTVQGELDRIDLLARENLTEARRSIAMLRPTALDEEQLDGALRRAVHATGLKHVTLRVSRDPEYVPPDVEVELYRIAEAALANAVQHSRATAIAVDLAYQCDGSVRVTVLDDGCGFNPDAATPGRFGLLGMSERAARVNVTLSLLTAIGEGTEVVAIWRPTVVS